MSKRINYGIRENLEFYDPDYEDWVRIIEEVPYKYLCESSEWLLADIENKTFDKFTYWVLKKDLHTWDVRYKEKEDD